LVNFVNSVQKLKSHAPKIAWLNLASFGGITRIRFKGFDRRFAPVISARWLPRTNFFQNKTDAREVNL